MTEFRNWCKRGVTNLERAEKAQEALQEQPEPVLTAVMPPADAAVPLGDAAPGDAAETQGAELAPLADAPTQLETQPYAAVPAAAADGSSASGETVLAPATPTAPKAEIPIPDLN